MHHYEINDIWALEKFASSCLYSYICAQKYRKEAFDSLKRNDVLFYQDVPAEIVRLNYYIESFHINLSEMYLFFTRKKDEEILSQLKLDKDHIKTYRNIRNSLSHFGKEGTPGPRDAKSPAATPSSCRGPPQ